MTILRYSADHKRALVLVEGSEPFVGVASVVDGTPMGVRWECSPGHLEAFAQVYADRFPIPPETCTCLHEQGWHAADQGPCGGCSCPRYAEAVTA